MALGILPVIERGILPIGTDAHEAKRAEILQAFGDKVPEELRLPAELIANPPLNVTEIPRTCGILSDEELAITENYDALGLAQSIASRKLTAVAVTKAFCKRSIIAHQLTCCLTQWFMDEAIARAQELDNHLERTGQTVGPLHGVPVSIKDHIAMAGHTSTVGIMENTQKDTEDSLVVSLLRKMGAVFYLKTNQPQSGMHLETDSFMGRTLNPFNINLSSGGSSGGESALNALKGSVLGVGSDIGGSVRGPAGFCGIYGFKPTTYLLPTQGILRGGFAGELNVIATIGPLCRSMRDMEFFCSSILSNKPHLQEARVVPLPWTGLTTPVARPLKIGIMRHDGVVQPQPPVARALAWAVAKIQNHVISHTSKGEAAPFQLKPYVPYQAATAMRQIHRMYYPDDVGHLRDAAAEYGETLHPLSEYVISLADGPELTATDVWTMRVYRDKFRDDFTEHFNSQDVDIVLCPVFVGPACAHDTSFFWNYTALWNFVDWPGVSVPTPIVVQKGETYAKAYKNAEAQPERAKSEVAPSIANDLKDADETVLKTEQSLRVKELWAKTDFAGAPVSLQLVARRYGENQLFGALSLLKDVLELP